MSILFAAVEVSTTKVRLLFMDEQGNAIWTDFVLLRRKSDQGIYQYHRLWLRLIRTLFMRAEKDQIPIQLTVCLGVTATTPTLIPVGHDHRPLSRKAVLWMDSNAVGQPNESGSDSGLRKLAYWYTKRACFRKAKFVLDATPYLLNYFTGRVTSSYPSLVQKFAYQNGGFDLSCFPKTMLTQIDLVDKIPMDILKMGECCGSLVESVANELGLRSGIPVVSCGFDSAAAIVGSGVLQQSNAMIVSFGTSITINVVPANQKVRVAGWSNRIGMLPDDYSVITGGIENGGPAFDILHNDVELTCAAASDCERDRHIRDHEYKSGPENVAIIGGLQRAPLLGKKLKTILATAQPAPNSLESTVAFRRSVAAFIRLAIEDLHQKGVSISSIRIVGGGAKSPAFTELLANMTQLPVRRMVVAIPGRGGEFAASATLGTAVLGGAYVKGNDWMRSTMAQVCEKSDQVDPSSEKKTFYDGVFANYKSLLDWSVKHEYA